MIRLEYAIPATPMPLFPTAAMVPATCVPCTLRSVGIGVVIPEVPAMDVIHETVSIIVQAGAGRLALVAPTGWAPGRGGRGELRSRNGNHRTRIAGRRDVPRLGASMSWSTGLVEVRLRREERSIGREID